MPNLVNSDTNPDPKLVNYYLNYVTQLEQGVPLTFTSGQGYDISALLTAAWGDVRTAWTRNSNLWGIRPPGITETLTGDIVGPSNPTAISTGGRATIGFSTGTNIGALNSTNGNSITNVNTSHCRIGSSNPYLFGVVNAYAAFFCGWPTIARTSNTWNYTGWIRNKHTNPTNFPNVGYDGTMFPRNLTAWFGTESAIVGSLVRVATENLTTAQNYYATNDLGAAGIFNPAISCSLTTPGADTIEIFLRDNVSPYNYIGQPYFLIQGPSTLNIGKIYKNNSMVSGRDWEGSDNPYWMCICKPAGGRTILMRVWTENIN